MGSPCWSLTFQHMDRIYLRLFIGVNTCGFIIEYCCFLLEGGRGCGR
ncbi:hypothetical protein [Pseudomonas phage vB_Pae_CF140a]|nr:hypothetical protein [Pseudomonas phage vB_Pae_CF140a]QBI77900.1 hypothetical protein [Pseudomonas phage vB_Pae_CF145a]QBI77937.1 hypothetical protein [Pseudomonas phage vB_Pae_CF165a]QBI78510.1 hypothetical protein [Pseudomonas phage vB_Pae_BR204a]QBI78616.1 hypothetical protein [Pseudomonas phage vB_Pae_BR233a]